MHSFDLILTLTTCLAIAALLGYITHRLHLSPIVGYLIAGLVVGHHTPGIVADQRIAEQLAEVGVILLMFGVGLEFHLKELLAVWRVAVPGAIVQSVVATLLTVVILLAAGWTGTAAVIFGLAISVASTVVLVRVLSDNRDLHTPAGHIAVGWLVMEDLFTVLVLVVLPVIFGPTATTATGIFWAMGLATIKVAILVGFIFIIGSRLIPWLLNGVVKTRSRELFTLTVLVIALGIAVGSKELLDVSMALGAFLAGMVVGRSEFSHRAASEAMPMRDAFAVLFFVSIGMLFSPAQLITCPLTLTLILVVILIGKPLSAMAIVLLFRYPFVTALTVAIALAQIGEFSFMLATVGHQFKILSDEATNILIAASILSITLNPLLYRLIDPFEKWASRRPRLWRFLNSRVASTVSFHQETPMLFRDRAIVVGYGPVGQIMVRLLKENDIEPVVIELNLETVRRLQSEEVSAVYGDASRVETLQAAGIAQAGILLLSSDALQSTPEIIRRSRELNPAIRVLARASYVSQLDAFRQAGADFVFSSEGEVALAFTEAILRSLGATADQIDRERERVHLDAFGHFPPAKEAILDLGRTDSHSVE